jgi:hypothetical protein
MNWIGGILRFRFAFAVAVAFGWGGSRSGIVPVPEEGIWPL